MRKPTYFYYIKKVEIYVCLIFLFSITPVTWRMPPKRALTPSSEHPSSKHPSKRDVLDQIAQEMHDLARTLQIHEAAKLLGMASRVKRIVDSAPQASTAAASAPSVPPPFAQACGGLPSVPAMASAALPPVPLFVSAQAGGGLAGVSSSAPVSASSGGVTCVLPLAAAPTIGLKDVSQQIMDNILGLSPTDFLRVIVCPEEPFPVAFKNWEVGEHIVGISTNPIEGNFYLRSGTKSVVPLLMDWLATKNLVVKSISFQRGKTAPFKMQLEEVLFKVEPWLLAMKFERKNTGTIVQFRNGPMKVVVKQHREQTEIRLSSDKKNEDVQPLWDQLMALLPPVEDPSSVAPPPAEGVTPRTMAARALALMADPTTPPALNTRSHVQQHPPSSNMEQVD